MNHVFRPMLINGRVLRMALNDACDELCRGCSFAPLTQRTCLAPFSEPLRLSVAFHGIFFRPWRCVEAEHEANDLAASGWDANGSPA